VCSSDLPLPDSVSPYAGPRPNTDVSGGSLPFWYHTHGGYPHSLILFSEAQPDTEYPRKHVMQKHRALRQLPRRSVSV
jgi:hypothetical protein